MLTSVRRTLLENSNVYYPFGNTRVRNVLSDCEFSDANTGLSKV